VPGEKALTPKESAALGTGTTTAGQFHPDAIPALLVIIAPRHFLGGHALNRAVTFGFPMAREGLGSELLVAVVALVVLRLHFRSPEIEKPPRWQGPCGVWGAVSR
jgi:hypothetical protein